MLQEESDVLARKVQLELTLLLRQVEKIDLQLVHALSPVSPSSNYLFHVLYGKNKLVHIIQTMCIAYN